MEYICKECNKKYSSYQSLWIHNKKFHNNKSTTCHQPVQNSIQNRLQECIPPNNIDNNVICKFCKKELSNRQSRWRHEQNCKNKDTQTEIKTEIIELKEKIQELTKKISNDKQTITNAKNSNINNGKIINQKIIINKTGTENITELTYEEVSAIFDNEISSVIKLIEFINFNDQKPENHSFCSTALESPYLSYYDTTTNTINKERKKYFFEEIICKHINNHEILYNKFKSKFNSTKRQQIRDNIYNLKQMRDNSFNNKIMQEIIRKLNLISYNNRDLIQDTWNGKKYDNDSDEEFMKMLLQDPENNNDIPAIVNSANNIPKKKNNIMKVYSSSDSESNSN